jgi:hypothetical protein
MKKNIEKLSYVFFILIAVLILTSWQSTAIEMECVTGVEPEHGENGYYCPSDYPIYCAVSIVFPEPIPSQFCCPEGYSCNWSEALNCCRCPSETIYKDNEETLTQLRKFRDNILSQSPIGRELIELYYEWSPSIVEAMEEDEEFKEDVKQMIDGVLELITKTE